MVVFSDCPFQSTYSEDATVEFDGWQAAYFFGHFFPCNAFPRSLKAHSFNHLGDYAGSSYVGGATIALERGSFYDFLFVDFQVESYHVSARGIPCDGDNRGVFHRS